MDLSILNEDPDKVYKVTFIEGDVLKLRGKAKTCLPVIFPIDYYLDKNNVKKDTEDQSLINFQKQIIFMYNSSNSLFFAGLMANGDFKIYNVKNKTWKFIRGLPYFATPPSKSLSIKDKPELFISNDGNLMLIKWVDKGSGDDYWIWTLLSTIHVKETMSIDESDKNGVWIRWVFDSLNERSQMIHSYSIDGSNSEQSNSESANFKINSSSSRIQNFERNPNLNFGYWIDAKFLKEDINEGTVVKIVQSKLFKIEDYYRSSVDSKNAHAISAVDHLKIPYSMLSCPPVYIWRNLGFWNFWFTKKFM